MGKAMKKKKKSLPEDLIVEILLKLPVKSLLRFRCVCKSWCNLIKSPNFIQRHLKNQCSTKNDSIIIIRGCLDLTTSLSFHDYETLSVISPRLEIPEIYDFNTHVCGPCNGLLCISDGETSIVLCNPAMRELKVLPPRPCPEGWEYRVRAIGFGFNSSTNDYKVVTFLCFYPSEEGDEDDDRDDYVDEEEIFVCEIYNLSTNTWREIDQDHYMPYIDDTPLHNGTLINGAFHWLASSKGNKCILSFNMSNEVFRDMKLPDPNERNCERLMVLNESLALLTYTWSPPEQKFVDIWVMHQYGVAKSWTKQFAIGPMTGIAYPLLLWKNEAILVESFEGLESSEGELVSCAIDTHEMDAFEIYGFRQTFRVMVYQESLVSIK